jgi:DNA-binding transcriptional ArsR family regulator
MERRPSGRHYGARTSRPLLPIDSSISTYLSIDLIKSMLYDSFMDIFYALAEPNRRRIVEILASKGALSASEICNRFQVSAPAISQHLKVLREANLLQMQKHAQQRMYQINPDAVMELEKWARQILRLWTERYDAFEQLLLSEQKKLQKRKKTSRRTFK